MYHGNLVAGNACRGGCPSPTGYASGVGNTMLPIQITLATSLQLRLTIGAGAQLSPP